jgi:Flp pilus assembly protein TadD
MHFTHPGLVFKHALLLATGLMALNLTGCTIIRPVAVKAPTDKQLQNVLTPPEIVTPEMLNRSPVDIMELSPAMIDLVKNRIPLDARPEKRLDRLFQVLRFDPDYAVEYESDATYTAQEVFQYRRANCLSFSAMFIALAREAGLDANFQEVELPPEWDALSDDTLVQYRHVNVKVRWSRGGEGVVDFRMDRYSETFPQKTISDSHGLAQYHSNVSMQHMVDGRMAEAYLSAYRAINADPSQSFIWSNMGIIQRRMGNVELAEIAYRQALTLNPRDISASNNLAILYETQGKQTLADEMRRYSEANKLNNPYYRYALAQHAYRNGNYDEALTQITVAMRKQSREHRFYFLRGLSLWNIGENESAINNVKRAIRMAKDDEPIEQYEQQLEEWLASNG